MFHRVIHKITLAQFFETRCIIMKANGFLLTQIDDIYSKLMCVCNTRKLHQPRTCVSDAFLADSVNTTLASLDNSCLPGSVNFTMTELANVERHAYS